MDDAVRRAASFVARNFPEAGAAFLGGSSATATATASSDLDIVVVLGDRWREVAFVETSTFEGQVVEVFVYGRDGLQHWLERGRANRRPTVDRILAEGVGLLGSDCENHLSAASQAVIGAGPAALTEEERRLRAYSLSGLVDDLEDLAAGDDEAATAVLAAVTWQAAAELALLVSRRWLGSGKWLLREIRRHPDRFGLVECLPGFEAGSVADTARRVLDEAGGYLQAGMVRGDRPADL